MRAPKPPWWQVTTSLKLAAVIGCCWLIAGAGELVAASLTGKVLLTVLGIVYLLFGVPGYITALVLLRRHRAAGRQRPVS